MSYNGAYYYIAYQWSKQSDQFELVFISHRKHELEGFVKRHVPLGCLIKGYRWSRFGSSPHREELIYADGTWAPKGGVLDE